MNVAYRCTVLFRLVAFLMSVSALSACAYQGGFASRGLPGGYSLIAVPVFKNATAEVGSEVYFTNAMVRELERSKAAKVIDKSEAQTTLEGMIESITYLGQNPVQNTQAPYLPPSTVLNTNYYVRVSTRLTLRRNSDQVVLWTSKFERERSYNAPRIGIPGINSANANYNQSARHQTIILLAQDMMSEAHDRLTESFW